MVIISFENVEISSVDIVNATCDDPNSGSAIVFIEGTNGPYQYSWLNADGQEISNLAASLGNLSAGDYQFTVSTESGCEDTAIITIDTDGDQVSDAFAGPDIETCDFQVNISGSEPVSGENGFWSIISGQGSFENLTNPTTTVSGLSFGENIFAIYKTLSKENAANDAQIYTFSFCSPELLRSNRTKISKSYRSYRNEKRKKS